jgi:2-polyprenyl-3-methyl-5-hydroxy-6-metoxy-1,4-benzoquinol methylase
MSNNWKSIWQSRSTQTETTGLLELIKLNGWDSPTGEFSIDNWLAYVEHMSRYVGIEKGDTIFEIGCGSGAFLYPLYQGGHEISGADYSEALVSIAKRLMPGGIFNVMEAIEVETDNKYDIVLSNGVFFYFPDLSYAKEVLRKMFRMARRKVAVLEVNDEKKRDLWLKNRMAALGEEEYKKKYRGLDHLFFTRQFFETVAEENSWAVTFVNTQGNIYPAAAYRFGAIFSPLTKRSI